MAQLVIGLEGKFDPPSTHRKARHSSMLLESRDRDRRIPRAEVQVR